MNLIIIAVFFAACIGVIGFYTYKYKKLCKSYHRFSKYIDTRYTNRGKKPSYAASSNFQNMKKELHIMERSIPYRWFIRNPKVYVKPQPKKKRG